MHRECRFLYRVSHNVFFQAHLSLDHNDEMMDPSDAQKGCREGSSNVVIFYSCSYCLSRSRCFVIISYRVILAFLFSLYSAFSTATSVAATFWKLLKIDHPTYVLCVLRVIVEEDNIVSSIGRHSKGARVAWLGP